MQRRTHTCLTILILLSAAACTAGGAVGLKSIELCADVAEDGVTAIDVVQGFSPDAAVIHGLAHMEGTRSGSVLKGAWISVDAISTPNYEIDSVEVAVRRNGPATGHFSLSRPTNGWPLGTYRLDVYADGQLLGSQTFRISAPAAEETTREPVAAPAGRAGRTHSHPAGFSFWYPASWNITEQDGMLQLVPAGAAQSPEGPLELYFLATEDIAGQELQGPTDPAVIEYLDGQVKSLSPVLEYTRRPAALQTDAGQGAVLVWQATTPDGRKVTARVFVVFIRQTAVMLIGMGLQERIDARKAELQDLFRSVTTGQVKAPASAAAQPSPPAAAAPEQPGADIAGQLRALEAARQAGILSEQEYAAKKKTLEDRQAQSIDPAARQKLEALESAYRAGILSEQEYQQKKAQLAGTRADGPAPQGGQTLGDGVSPKVGGKTYRHVIGFTFWHPADWTVKEHEEMLQLMPANASKTAAGDPTEIYLILGDSTVGQAGITTVEDPRVIQFMDQALTQLSPQLRRTSAPTPLSMATGKGLVMNWQGTSPTGEVVGARAYVCLINDYGIALVALCLQDRLQARETELQRIFTSFAFGEGQRDLQLAGTWTRIDKSHMIAGAGGVWLESNDTKESKGIWYAGNGSLHLIWDDKSWQEYKYEIRQTPQGIRLLLTSGGKGELWQRVQ